MDTDLYQPPSSKTAPLRRAHSTRFTHCCVAWLSGFLAFPATYLVMRAAGTPAISATPLSNLAVQDVLACVTAGVVAALAVAPFRRVPLWLAGMAGILPLALFLLFAIALVVYRATA